MLGSKEFVEVVIGHAGSRVIHSIRLSIIHKESIASRLVEYISEKGRSIEVTDGRVKAPKARA